MKNIKSIEKRLEECVTIRMQLRQLNMNDLPELSELRTIMTNFIKYAHSDSGSILIPDINKKINYILSINLNIDSNIIIKHVN